MKILKTTVVVISLITFTGCFNHDKGVQNELRTLKTISRTSPHISNMGKTHQQTATSQSTRVTSYLNGLQSTASGVSELDSPESGLNELNNTQNSIKSINRGVNQVGTTATQQPSEYSTLESNATQVNEATGFLNEDQIISSDESGLNRGEGDLNELNSTLNSMKTIEHQAGLNQFNSLPLMLTLLLLLPVLWMIFVKYIRPQRNHFKIT